VRQVFPVFAVVVATYTRASGWDRGGTSLRWWQEGNLLHAIDDVFVQAQHAVHRVVHLTANKKAAEEQTR